MKTLNVLFVTLMFLFFACSDASDKLNTELVKPPLPEQLGFSQEQIKYWYSQSKDYDQYMKLIEENDSTLKFQLLTKNIVYQFQNNKCVRIGDIRVALNNNMSQSIIKTLFKSLKQYGFKEGKTEGNVTIMINSVIPNLKAMYSQVMNDNRTNLMHIVMYYKE